MDHSQTNSDLGSISFTYDQDHRVSHSNDLNYPGDDSASLIQIAIEIIEQALSFSLSISSDGEYEEGNTLVVLRSVSEMIHGLRALQSSVVFNNPTLKEVYHLAQNTESAVG